MKNLCFFLTAVFFGSFVFTACDDDDDKVSDFRDFAIGSYSNATATAQIKSEAGLAPIGEQFSNFNIGTINVGRAGFTGFKIGTMFADESVIDAQKGDCIYFAVNKSVSDGVSITGVSQGVADNVASAGSGFNYCGTIKNNGELAYTVSASGSDFYFVFTQEWLPALDESARAKFYETFLKTVDDAQLCKIIALNADNFKTKPNAAVNVDSVANIYRNADFWNVYNKLDANRRDNLMQNAFFAAFGVKLSENDGVGRINLLTPYQVVYSVSARKN